MQEGEQDWSATTPNISTFDPSEKHTSIIKTSSAQKVQHQLPIKTVFSTNNKIYERN